MEHIAVLASRDCQEHTVSKEGIEGAAKKGMGAIKEGVGKMTGNHKMEAEGVAEKIAGSAEEAVGKMKDAVHKATK